MSHEFPPLPPSLASKISAGQVVAFVGAGLTTPIGMPTWNGLLRKLISAARETKQGNAQALAAVANAQTHFDNRAYMDAAWLLTTDVFTDDELETHLRFTFSSQCFHNAEQTVKKKMEQRLRNITQVPWAGLITTNYDNLLEEAFTLYRPSAPSPIICRGADRILGSVLAIDRSHGPFLAKIHGDNWQSDRVLTLEQYAHHYLGTSRIKEFLSAVMLRYPLLFLGSSLEPEILRIRQELSQTFDRILPTSFALLPKTPEFEARQRLLKKEYLIEPIFYSVGSDRSHLSFDTFLAELARVGEPMDDESIIPPSGSAWPRMPGDDYTNRLGHINAQLLHWIREQANHVVRHDAISLSHDRLRFGTRRGSLAQITTNEILYRIYYMMALGLIERVTLEDGKVYYRALTAPAT